jgi:hypothetical protein
VHPTEHTPRRANVGPGPDTEGPPGAARSDERGVPPLSAPPSRNRTTRALPFVRAAMTRARGAIRAERERGMCCAVELDRSGGGGLRSVRAKTGPMMPGRAGRHRGRYVCMFSVLTGTAQRPCARSERERGRNVAARLAGRRARTLASTGGARAQGSRRAKLAHIARECARIGRCALPSTAQTPGTITPG